MGKGSVLAIAGIAIVAFIVIAYVIVPSVNMPNNMNFQWSAYGMKDGRQVTGPFAFMASGVEIDSIGCEASWSAQGEDIDWNTLEVSGDFTIWLCDRQGNPQTDISPSGLDFMFTGPAAQEETVRFEVTCSSLLEGQPYSGYTEGGGQLDLPRTPFWVIMISFTALGQVEQTRSDLPVLQDSIEDSRTYTVFWDSADFSLTGGIV